MTPQQSALKGIVTVVMPAGEFMDYWIDKVLELFAKTNLTDQQLADECLRLNKQRTEALATLRDF